MITESPTASDLLHTIAKLRRRIDAVLEATGMQPDNDRLMGIQQHARMICADLSETLDCLQATEASDESEPVKSDVYDGILIDLAEQFDQLVWLESSLRSDA